MAINDTSHVQRIYKGFATVLKSAACECFLIVLLFVDASLSYLLTRFAHYCGLQSPCIVCSRLDHVFRSEEPGYYWNLFCSKHRSEISLLIACNIHGKLVDGRSVCENCLSSHIEDTKSYSYMQRVSLGNLGVDPAGFGYYVCLCCNEPWTPGQNAQGLSPLKSRGIAVAKSNINFPRCLRSRSGMKKIKEKSSAPVEACFGKTGFDPPSHDGYTELKITSESEHEIPFSEDEVSSCMVPDTYKSKKDSLVQSAPEAPSKRLCSNSARRKQSDANEHYDVTCLPPDVLSDNDACDSNEQLADQKSNRSIFPEVISLDDIPASSCLEKVDKPTSIDVTENPYETSLRKLADVTEASKNENIPINKDRALKLISKSSGADFETDRVVDDIAVVHPRVVYMPPVCGEEKSEPMFVMEEPMPTYNNGVNKDRSLPDQYSSGEGIQLSFNNCPELQDNSDDFDEETNESNPYGTTDESNHYGVQSFDNYFIQRSDFGSLESLHESTFNEIEGEDPVDRLKRQNEHYRKCVNDLHKEFEEERNASAIAANQAMAMITRLQEEKSALQMETLHYLRMMDEQADHNGDALDKANDLLSEKEKEIQDLEAELEFYRLNITDEALMEILPEASINLMNRQASMESTTTSSVKDDNLVAKSAWSQCEEEKLYIYERLRDLEMRVIGFAHHVTSPHISDGEYFDTEANGDQHLQESIDEKDEHANPEVEGNDVLVQKASSVSNGSVPSQEQSNTSISKDQVVSKGNNHSVSNGLKGSEDCNKTDLVSLQNEISDLHEKLEALVADCKFLEDCLKSLQDGNEGRIFIQGILQELRELRKLGLRSRNMSLS
ncbi:myosin-binding protein 3-like [Hibiscus syriacus]|uniref:myosin-binding protein 3-like n=1 Tax=Hibiscus syriacus TaxID=106335 RepID=UPI001924B48D|nr:myosin-binding protein 3-like [Hibiscus syriacus]